MGTSSERCGAQEDSPPSVCGMLLWVNEWIYLFIAPPPLVFGIHYPIWRKWTGAWLPPHLLIFLFGDSNLMYIPYVHRWVIRLKELKWKNIQIATWERWFTWQLLCFTSLSSDAETHLKSYKINHRAFYYSRVGRDFSDHLAIPFHLTNNKHEAQRYYISYSGSLNKFIESQL